MLLRNRELLRAALASLAVAAAAALAAQAAYGDGAAAAVLLACVAVSAVWLAATVARYRALARLASQVDDVLHGARDVSFQRMREGEVALLASELDKMTNRLALANEGLAREKNALADALADISHQLKTPLTSLSLMTVLQRKRLAEAAGDDPSLGGEVARLREMEELERRVEWLVSSLLKLARIDAGVVSFSSGRVEAQELVRRAFEPLAIAFDLADVSFSADVASGCGFVGDVAWTAEALENVLKNCLEHTPAGGSVRLTAVEDAIACRIRVEDTGGGIAEADLPHVFERFYRGSERDAAAGGGSEVNPSGVGIGLALAQSLVTAQGGSIRAGNTGRGAAFDIVFFKAVV